MALVVQARYMGKTPNQITANLVGIVRQYKQTQRFSEGGCTCAATESRLRALRMDARVGLLLADLMSLRCRLRSISHATRTCITHVTQVACLQTKQQPLYKLYFLQCFHL